jgi:hypothetical protein
MWLMKRAVVDGWAVDRALDEATQLGLANPALQQFFLEEIKKRKK